MCFRSWIHSFPKETLASDCARWSAMSEPLMPNRWHCAPFLQLWRARREKEHFHEADYEHDLAYLQKRLEVTMRSEERRVGKECRYRLWASTLNKKKREGR